MAIQSMTTLELKEKMEKGENFVLVDCREQEEWNAGHIPGAIFIPLSKFAHEYEKIGDKKQTIIMQCRSGRRSLNACHFLDEEGYSDLYNLEGGILEWAERGLPIKID